MVARIEPQPHATSPGFLRPAARVTRCECTRMYSNVPECTRMYPPNASECTIPHAVLHHMRTWLWLKNVPLQLLCVSDSCPFPLRSFRCFVLGRHKLIHICRALPRSKISPPKISAMNYSEHCSVLGIIRLRIFPLTGFLQWQAKTKQRSPTLDIWLRVM